MSTSAPLRTGGLDARVVSTGGPFVRFLRFLGRYVIAIVMIPVGVALGVGGLIQFAWRRARRPKAQV